MKMPSNMTEPEVLEVIDKVVRKLAPRYVFGFYDVDDIKQEGRKFALQGLRKYDENRPLENFLYSHVRNRLINFKRDNYRRNDPPCQLCHGHPANETLHDDQFYCTKYTNWLRNNQSKQNIMNTLDIANICDEKEPTTRTESSVLEDIEINELLRIIDEKLPVELRASYLQMRANVSIPKARRLEVENAIKEILGDALCLNPTNEEL